MSCERVTSVCNSSAHTNRSIVDSQLIENGCLSSVVQSNNNHFMFWDNKTTMKDLITKAKISTLTYFSHLLFRRGPKTWPTLTPWYRKRALTWRMKAFASTSDFISPTAESNSKLTLHLGRPTVVSVTQCTGSGMTSSLGEKT